MRYNILIKTRECKDYDTGSGPLHNTMHCIALHSMYSSKKERFVILNGIDL